MGLREGSMEGEALQIDEQVIDVIRVVMEPIERYLDFSIGQILRLEEWRARSRRSYQNEL